MSVVCTRTRANQAFSTTAFANLDDLVWWLAPNAHYKFRFFGAYTSALAATGLQLSVSGPASPDFVAFIGQIHSAAGSVFGGVGGNYDVAIAATAGSVTAMPFWVEGSISTGASGGLLQLRVRSETNGNVVTILRGSVGELTAVDG